ncbi:unnamed protein product [Meganyctiphanes norvegica]|uniref:Uncharacterized protein n=1 Tax=Meganyctiphanes norvegica TaxID=48144 RepID=A0AAV2RC38_MEGNR
MASMLSCVLAVILALFLSSVNMIEPALVGTWREGVAKDAAFRALGVEQVSRDYVCVDLPPFTGSDVRKPPSFMEFWGREKDVCRDRRVPAVAFIGADEFARGQLGRLSNMDETLISISPHVVPNFDPRVPLFRENLQAFVRLHNFSLPGQSWHEVVADDDLIESWCGAQPRVTVLQLGLWDIVCGHMSWNADAPATFFAHYVRVQLREFVARAKDISVAKGLDPFDPWFTDHTFIFINLPPWFQYTEALEQPDTIRVEEWEPLRRNVYRAIRSIANLLWFEFHLVVLSPPMAGRPLCLNPETFLLQGDSTLRYVSLVMATVARILCRRFCCRRDLNAMNSRSAIVLPGELDCGPLRTWYFRPGETWDDVYEARFLRP